MVTLADGTSTTTAVPNLAICNLAPVNGAPMNVEYKGMMTGADPAKTVINFSFPAGADGFACFTAPAPPAPVGPVGPPKPTPNPDSNIGKACANKDSMCGNSDDKK